MSGADTRPDDFEPADLPAKARAAYGDKLALGTGQTVALAVMAGAFIAFGSVFFLTRPHPKTDPTEPARTLGGISAISDHPCSRQTSIIARGQGAGGQLPLRRAGCRNRLQ